MRAEAGERPRTRGGKSRTEVTQKEEGSRGNEGWARRGKAANQRGVEEGTGDGKDISATGRLYVSIIILRGRLSLKGQEMQLAGRSI